MHRPSPRPSPTPSATPSPRPSPRPSARPSPRRRYPVPSSVCRSSLGAFIFAYQGQSIFLEIMREMKQLPGLLKQERRAGRALGASARPASGARSQRGRERAPPRGVVRVVGRRLPCVARSSALMIVALTTATTTTATMTTTATNTTASTTSDSNRPQSAPRLTPN